MYTYIYIFHHIYRSVKKHDMMAYYFLNLYGNGHSVGHLVT